MKQKHEIALLQNSNSDFKEDFYRYSKTLQFEKGSSPFGTDDLLKYFYIVLEGRVKTYQINFENAKEQTLFIYRRGDMFDVISLLDEQPHEVIYEVIEPLSVLQLPIERVRYWLDHDSTFNRQFFPYLASQMRYSEELASDLSLLDTKERLINLLIQNLNPDNHFKYNLLQNLSNSEIAKLLGTVRHVVERSLKQLKEDRVIETKRKNIKVLDFQKLLQKTSKMLLK